jgi:hypothetical protein
MFSLNGIDLEPHPRESHGATDSGAIGLSFSADGFVARFELRDEGRATHVPEQIATWDFPNSRDHAISEDVAPLRMDCTEDFPA